MNLESTSAGHAILHFRPDRNPIHRTISGLLTLILAFESQINSRVVLKITPSSFTIAFYDHFCFITICQDEF